MATKRLDRFKGNFAHMFIGEGSRSSSVKGKMELTDLKLRPIICVERLIVFENQSKLTEAAKTKKH